MRYIVHTQSPYRVYDSVEDSSKLQLRKDRPHVWLQKICVKILTKLGAYSLTSTSKIDYKTVDADSLIRYVFETRQDIMREFNTKADIVLMGHDSYVKLIGELPFSMRFQSEPMPFYTGYQQIEMHPVTVICVPWLHGIALLNKELFNERKIEKTD